MDTILTASPAASSFMTCLVGWKKQFQITSMFHRVFVFKYPPLINRGTETMLLGYYPVSKLAFANQKC